MFASTRTWRAKKVRFGTTAPVFPMKKENAFNECKWCHSDPQLPRGPLLLPDEGFRNVIDTIQSDFAGKAPVSCPMLIDVIEINSIFPDVPTMREIECVSGLPMEREGIECNAEGVTGFSDELEAMRKDIPAALISNIDDSSHCVWAVKSETYRMLVSNSDAREWIFVLFGRQ